MHGAGARPTSSSRPCSQAGPLAPLPYASGLVLKPDETEYVAAEAGSYRYYGLDGGSYVHSTFLMGGPFMMAATGFASAMGNRSRRTAAQYEAMPRWRYGGVTRAVLTSAWLLTSSEGQWISFYLGGIIEINPHPAQYTVTIAFEESPPLSLRGPWIPYLLDRVLLPPPRSGRSPCHRAPADRFTADADVARDEPLDDSVTEHAVAQSTQGRACFTTSLPATSILNSMSIANAGSSPRRR